MLDLKTFKSALEQLEKKGKFRKKKYWTPSSRRWRPLTRKNFGKKGQISPRQV